MAKVAETKKELVETEQKASLPPSVLADLDMATLTADAGASVSDMASEDMALPYLSILQALSPQVQPGKAEYIEGAVASMFYNNVSQDFYEGRNKGIIFVPCYYERKYVEWRSREDGGGWIGEHDISSDVLNFTKKDDKGKLVMKETNHQLVESAFHFGLMQDPDTGVWSQCVISLKSTSLKVNRRWNNELATTKIPGTELTAPRWLYPYRLTTFLESRKNNSWWQWRLERVEVNGVATPVSRAVYDKAKQFHNLAKGGEVKRAVEKEAPIDNGGQIDGAGHERDDDIPF